MAALALVDEDDVLELEPQPASTTAPVVSRTAGQSRDGRIDMSFSRCVVLGWGERLVAVWCGGGIWCAGLAHDGIAPPDGSAVTERSAAVWWPDRQ